MAAWQSAEVYNREMGGIGVADIGAAVARQSM
jgi:hypothetical protein